MSGFRGPYATPTDDQAALIGHIVSDWAILDFALGQIATRLALCPDYPARSLTDRLPGAALEAAICRLLDMHAGRYRGRIVSAEVASRLTAAIKRAKRLRARRNAFAHAIGMRMSDDELALIDLRGWGTAGSGESLSIADLNGLRIQILKLASDISTLAESLPEISEDEALRLAGYPSRGAEPSGRV